MRDRHRTQSRFFLVVLALIGGSVLCALALPVLRGASAQSPTGKYNGLVAFVTNRNGPPGEIYVMNPDGSNQRNITTSSASETRPAFAPDGQKIAFVRDFKAILTMNPDGGGQTMIVDGAVAGLSSITSFPSWSPDGKKIVFKAIAKDSPNGADIYVINADGTGLTRLTTDPADDSSPAWSPDGTKIAFASLRNPSPGDVNYEIYVMNADGSHQTRLTNNTQFDHSPSWSPDGQRIAFTSRRDDNFELYGMNADGTNPTRLTNNPEQDSDAKWSPDGTKIVFMSSRDGRFGEIYTMNPDGTGLVNLTDTRDVFDMDPSWQPALSPFMGPSPTPTPAASPTPSPDPMGLIWQPYLPSAAQTDIEVSTCGARAFAKVKIVFNDTSYRITDWGHAQLTNNNFLVDIKAEHFTNGGAAQVIVPLERVYDLGNLGPGSYTFTVASRGVVIKSKSFNTGGAPTADPLNDPSLFVSQHYQDFLGRGPDDQGFGFWTRNILVCGTDAACLERKRIDTSAAFFLSIEFQQTGFMVYRLYRASYGRMPRREEFLPDARSASFGVIVNSPGWQAALADNARAFADDWVNRPDFKFNFDQLSDAQYVDRLIANTGNFIAAGDREGLVLDLLNHKKSRSEVLRAIADDPTFNQREFNRAFVLMQYFGYLQRNPDEGPNSDMSGYNFWLAKLNQFNGDYVRAEMVKAFLSSTEFNARFCSQ
ncbi:MAG: DUF4214 domain-containing protein [Pyrinomonadaceae bacterium]